MGKPGPRIGEDTGSTKTRLLALISETPPGMTFTQIVQAARKLGFSKPTVWRYLTRFEELGLVIHEGKAYRKNPLFGNPINQELFFHQAAAGTFEEGKIIKRDFATLRKRPIEGWSQIVGKEKPKDLSDPAQLFAALEATMLLSNISYLNLLTLISYATDSASAREIANILIDGQVKPLLMGLARQVWESPGKVRWEGLEGKEIKWQIHMNELTVIL
jgi:predicted transcriptional regulator